MQKINVKVFPKAKKRLVLPLSEQGSYKVYVTSPAIDGKANKAVVEILADFFGVKKSNIKIVLGEKSKNKTIGIST